MKAIVTVTDRADRRRDRGCGPARRPLGLGQSRAAAARAIATGSTSHENRYGGSSTHEAGEGTEHTNTYGGSTAHATGGGTEHTNVVRRHHLRRRTAPGATHTYASGATAYHPPARLSDYPAYHPPVAVPYYASTCYGCAAAAGAVVGVAAGAAVASANTAAATSNAYAAGVATGSANTAAATSAAYNAGVATGVAAASRSRRNLRDGRQLRGAAGRLDGHQQERHDLLPQRQHVVPAGLSGRTASTTGRRRAMNDRGRSALALQRIARTSCEPMLATVRCSARRSQDGYDRLARFFPAAIAAASVSPGAPPVRSTRRSRKRARTTGYTFQTRQKHFKSQENLVILAFSGGGTRAAAFSYGVLEFLRRTEVDRTQGQQGPPARRRRHDHRRVGRQLHRAGLWPLRRQAVRRLRAALPQARRPGRAHRPRHQSGATGASCRRRAGAAPNWRPSSTTRSCSTARPSATSTAATVRSSWRRRPTSRPAAGCPSTRTSGTCCARISMPCDCPAPPPRRRPFPSCSPPITINNYGGTCNYDRPGLGQDVYPIRESAAARGARDTRAEGCPNPTPTASIAPISISWTAACPTTWACAACSTRWSSSRPCTTRACRHRSTTCKQDHRLRRQFAVVAAHQLGRIGEPARHGGHPAEGHRRSDRSLFLRGGRAAEGHRGAVAKRRGRSASWPGVRPTRTRRSAPRSVPRTRRSTPSTCRSPCFPTRRSATT